MKNYLLIPFLLFISLITRSQSINYEKDSLPNILQIAKGLNKPVFVFIASPLLPGAKVIPILQKPEVTNFFNENFLNYNSAPADSIARAIARKYFINGFPTYLYLDGNDNIVHRSSGFPMSSPGFLDDARAALNKFKTGKTISWYQSEIAQGNATAGLYKDYIAECQKMGIEDNHLLIDEYVKLRPVQNFDSFDEVLFVLEAGPIIPSRAFQLSAFNRKILDSISKALPAQRQYTINMRISRNTMSEAIRKKDRLLATQAASLASTTAFKTNFRKRQRVYEGNMLNYYKAVKDTATYFSSLVRYNDNYSMNVSADSILKLKQTQADRTAANAGLISVPDMNGFSQYYANMPPPVFPVADLLRGARDIYSMKSTNPKYHAKALAWARKATEIDPGAYPYDILAHILYFQGSIEEAIKMEQAAIDLSDDVIITTYLKAELRRMQLKKP